MRLTAVVICITGLIVSCESGSVSTVPAATPSPTSSPSALVVFTTWAADPKVTNGPEPGYKPAFTGLTGHDIQNAAARTYDAGSTWTLELTFTPHGTDLFAQLTRDNVPACPEGSGSTPSRDCPQHHLGIRLDLTQADVNRWDEAAYVAKVSQPFDLACLSHGPATTACPKFVSDPVTVQEITGGRADIGCPCTEQRLRELAAAINAESR